MSFPENSRTIKITPHSTYATTPVADLDQCLNVKFLTNSKFDGFKSALTDRSKIRVYDKNKNPISSYVDDNFSSQSEGTIWFKGLSSNTESYYINIADHSESNNASVFSNHDIRLDMSQPAHPLVESTGNRTFRSYPTSAIYNKDGLLGKAIELVSIADTSDVDLINNNLEGIGSFSMSSLMNLKSNGSIFMISGQVVLYYCYLNAGNLLHIFQWDGAVSAAILPGASSLILDKWALFTVVYDGSGASDTDKFKFYINGESQTMSFMGDPIQSNLRDDSFGRGDWRLSNTTPPPNGNQAISADVDEFRCSEGVYTSDEVSRYSDMFMNNGSYWIASVLPSMDGISYIEDDVYRITGSGLALNQIYPTLSLNGKNIQVISATDTETICTIPTWDANDTNILTLVNNDGQETSRVLTTPSITLKRGGSVGSGGHNVRGLSNTNMGYGFDSRTYIDNLADGTENGGPVRPLRGHRGDLETTSRPASTYEEE